MVNEEGRDLVLPNNTYAHVLDETKGNIICYVGPSKIQLADTDRPVVFDSDTKKYRKTGQTEAVKQILVAPEGWYAVLKNPTKDRAQPNPSSNDTISIDKLEVGRKVHMPGPVSFPLWPGQIAKVIQGHRLRTNQYLIVRVYDADAAKENWGDTIIQTTSHVEGSPEAKVADVDTTASGTSVDDAAQAGSADSENVENVDAPDTSTTEVPVAVVDTGADNILDAHIDFTVGKLMIVKGTDVSFFIPPTGIEVVKDSNDNYIREAVTLERLIYCVLLDESGSKRYIRGPAVVFPRPTEAFQTHTVRGRTTRRFRAIELNSISGIYVKVIAAYREDGVDYAEGEELFITGTKQAIYYRRDEHQLITYDNKEIHYATAVPKGEAIYVLNRVKGDIYTIPGPAMYLPDPRTEVIVRRALPIHLARLMYPGNNDVVDYNKKLLDTIGSPTDFVTDTEYASMSDDQTLARSFRSTAEALYSSNGKKGSPFEDTNVLAKSSEYTKPRTVTLDTKYNGAVRLQIWTGYAIIVVNGVGQRKVIEGPATYNLEYDEYPEVVSLSTGKPKNTDKLVRDIYLRTKNNKVSDIITVETRDMVEVDIKLSYRLNFVGNSDVWFDVENYVKFLCDHMRSKLKGQLQTMSLDVFYADSVNITRDIILGEKKEGNKRGFLFEENNMFVYDVEVLKVTISDYDIANEIQKTQNEIVTSTINTARKNELLALKKKLAALEAEDEKLALEKAEMHCTSVAIKEDYAQKTLRKSYETSAVRLSLEAAEEEKEIINNSKNAALRVSEKLKIDRLALADEVEKQEALDVISIAETDREEHRATLAEERALREHGRMMESISAKSTAIAAQMGSITPGLVEALTAQATVMLGREVMPHAIPLSVVEGRSVGHTLSNLFEGTSFGTVLTNMVNKTDEK